MAITRNAEWLCWGVCSIAMVSEQRLLRGACLASHSFYLTRALAAMVPHGEFTSEMLHVWRIASHWALVHGAGSCHPCSYCQLKLVPWADTILSCPLSRGGMICDRQGSRNML